MANLVKKIRTSSGDLQIDYSALANLPSINNNMLINGDFKINQRGSENYIQTNTWKYSVDRWKYIGLMTVTANESGTVTLSKSDNNDATYFSQQLEDIHGAGNFTFSFRVKSISGTMEAYIEGGGGVILTVTKPGIYQVTSSSGAKGVNFRLMGSAATVELQWAKLEAGATATAFVSRLRAEEIMLCQRYYEKRSVLFLPVGASSPYANYIAVNGGQHFVEKRTIPTIAIDTLYNENGATSNVTVKANTCTTQSFRSISLNDNSQCTACMLSGVVTFDSEIY